MKNSKKNFGVTGQSKTDSTKPQKHDANLQKNSSLYFQIGLILCLLATYGLFEMTFQTKVVIPESLDYTEKASIDVAPPFIEEVVKVKKEPEPKLERKTELIDRYKEIEDTTKQLESAIITADEKAPEFVPVDPGSLPDDEDPEDEDIFVPFTVIEEVPIFPGCEKYDTNDKRKKCMSKKIGRLINRKFDTSIGSKYGMTGELVIQTQFTIDKTGNVTEIKTRGPHPILEKEARRVINKIPQMKPGYQQDQPVGVIYTLPITFYVDY